MGGLNVLNLGMAFKKWMWMFVDRMMLVINIVEQLNSWLRAMN
jgi:hypothetical protein